MQRIQLTCADARDLNDGGCSPSRMGASSLVRSWLAELWTDHLGVHDPGEGRTARPVSFATFATAVTFGFQFGHTAPPSGRDHVADPAVDAIASGVGEGLPPVRDLFNKPTLLDDPLG